MVTRCGKWIVEVVREEVGEREVYISEMYLLLAWYMDGIIPTSVLLDELIEEFQLLTCRLFHLLTMLFGGIDGTGFPINVALA